MERKAHSERASWSDYARKPRTNVSVEIRAVRAEAPEAHSDDSLWYMVQARGCETDWITIGWIEARRSKDSGVPPFDGFWAYRDTPEGPEGIKGKGNMFTKSEMFKRAVEKVVREKGLIPGWPH